MIVLEGDPNIKLGNTLYERYSEGTPEALEGIEQILELIKDGFIRNATLDGVYLRFLERLTTEPRQKNSVTHALQSELEEYFNRLFISYDEHLAKNNLFDNNLFDLLGES